MTKRAVMIGAGAFCAVGVLVGVLFGLYADSHDLHVDTRGGSAAVVVVVMLAAVVNRFSRR